MIIHEQRFGCPLAFVVTSSDADWVDAAAIRFRLRVDFGIAVNFAGGGLEDFRVAAFGYSERGHCAEHGRLESLNRVVLVMAGSRRTSQIVNLIDFEPDRPGDIVPDHLEVRHVEQVGDIGLLAGEKIIQTDDVVALFDQPFAQMRSEKPCPAGHQNSLNL